MRGSKDHLTIGERVAFYRKRRGLTQPVLAELVGRGKTWLRHIEAGRNDLDRLSMIRELATVLGVSVGDLIGTPILLEWKSNGERGSIPAIRAALTDHARYLSGITADGEPVSLEILSDRVRDAFNDYQGSHYTRLTVQLPDIVNDATNATRTLTGEDQRRAFILSAQVHQLCGVYLPKLGETDLALLAAGKGLEFAQLSGDVPTIASLYRNVAYALGALGQQDQAVALAAAAIQRLGPALNRSDSSGHELSVYGMLYLVAGRAAAQIDDRPASLEYLSGADRVAARLGKDENFGWTGFGPTNVVIHRVACAVELGDLQQAAEMGPQLDTTRLPVERRGRHAIEAARALSGVGRTDEAVNLLADAERFASEQILHHHQSREVIRRAVRHRSPSNTAMELAARMRIADL